MKQWTYALSLFCIAAMGCSMGTSVPSDEQIKRDLVGQLIQAGGIRWRVADSELKGFVVQQRFTDKKANTDEVHAGVTLDDSTTTIKGVLVLSYKKYEQGWKIESVKPEGAFTITKECRPGVQCDWYQATDYCKREGSRLPTKDELEGMYKSECEGIARRSANCNGYYWSSTEVSGAAWIVSFDTGGVLYDSKSSTSYYGYYYVRCVRAGP